MMWAFAREQAIPGHRYFRVISSSTKTPRRTVWLAVVGALLLGLPLLKVCHPVLTAEARMCGLCRAGLHP